jgi:hypothetical protein
MEASLSIRQHLPAAQRAALGDSGGKATARPQIYINCQSLNRDAPPTMNSSKAARKYSWLVGSGAVAICDGGGGDGRAAEMTGGGDGGRGDGGGGLAAGGAV